MVEVAALVRWDLVLRTQADDGAFGQVSRFFPVRLAKNAVGPFLTCLDLVPIFVYSIAQGRIAFAKEFFRIAGYLGCTITVSTRTSKRLHAIGYRQPDKS